MDDLFILKCRGGEPLGIKAECLAKIPYFNSITASGKREYYVDVTTKSCWRLIYFAEKDEIAIPNLHEGGELLEIAMLWSYDTYIDAFLEKYIGLYGHRDISVAEIINYLALTNRFDKYSNWLDWALMKISDTSCRLSFTPGTFKKLMSYYEKKKPDIFPSIFFYFCIVALSKIFV